MAATLGCKSSVGTSAVQLLEASTPLTYGVWVKADPTNANNVYVGFSSAVTASTDATAGYPLDAAQEVFIPIAAFANAAANLNVLYVIADTGTQRVYFMAL